MFDIDLILPFLDTTLNKLARKPGMDGLSKGPATLLDPCRDSVGRELIILYCAFALAEFTGGKESLRKELAIIA